MMSSGVTDRCIIQWSYKVHTIESVAPLATVAVKAKRSLKPTKQITSAESSGETPLTLPHHLILLRMDVIV